MKFENQKVLITGASRGIGLNVAENFAKAGAHVILLARNADALNEIVTDFKAQNLSAEAWPCDITDYDQIQEIINKVLDNHKAIDILINNAGVTSDALFVRLQHDDWLRVINTNLNAVYNCTRLIVKAMLKQRKGRIINISSVIGIAGNAGQTNYAASKAAIIGFSKSLALEVASRGINVNVVAPGYINTDMTSNLSEKVQNDILTKIPIKRFGNPQDISEACLFLASDQSKYITGQTLIVDGGMTI